MKRLHEMSELEDDEILEKTYHNLKNKRYSEELHGNIHEHCHHNLKKNLKI